LVVNTGPPVGWLGEQAGRRKHAAHRRQPALSFPAAPRQIVTSAGRDPAGDPWRCHHLGLATAGAPARTVASGTAPPWPGRWSKGDPDRRPRRAALATGVGRWAFFTTSASYSRTRFRPGCRALTMATAAGCLAPLQGWQARLFRRLHDRLGVKPFGLRVIEAIERLGQARPHDGLVGPPAPCFGLSSSAPLSGALLQPSPAPLAGGSLPAHALPRPYGNAAGTGAATQ